MGKLITLAATAAVFVSSAANACLPPMVTFDFGSTQVSPKDEDVTRVVEAFRAKPESRVKLSALNDGSNVNLKMSRRRALAVKAALMRLGVPARKIDIDTGKAGPRDLWARTVWMEVVSNNTCG